jgi:hypothetical protein
VDKRVQIKAGIVEIIDHEKNKSSIVVSNGITKRYFRHGWL